MKAIVVDSSVALSWGLPDESNSYADAVLHQLAKQSMLVPALWAIEIANGLAMAERRGRCTLQDCEKFLALIGALPVLQDSRQDSRDPGPAAAEVFQAARKYALTAYDAAYLELALREGALLATLDDALRKAARKAGVRLA